MNPFDPNHTDNIYVNDPFQLADTTNNVDNPDSFFNSDFFSELPNISPPSIPQIATLPTGQQQRVPTTQPPAPIPSYVQAPQILTSSITLPNTLVSPPQRLFANEIENQSTTIEPMYQLVHETKKPNLDLIKIPSTDHVKLQERDNDLLHNIVISAAEYISNFQASLTAESRAQLETSIVNTQGSLKFVIDDQLPKANLFYNKAIMGLHAILNSGGLGTGSVNGASHLFRMMGLYFDYDRTFKEAERVSEKPPSVNYGTPRPIKFNRKLYNDFKTTANYLPLRKKLEIEVSNSLPTWLLNHLKTAVLNQKIRNWIEITNKIQSQFTQRRADHVHHIYRLLIGLERVLTPFLFIDEDEQAQNTKIWFALAEFERQTFKINTNSRRPPTEIMVFTSLIKNTDTTLIRNIFHPFLSEKDTEFDEFSITIPNRLLPNGYRTLTNYLDTNFNGNYISEIVSPSTTRIETPLSDKPHHVQNADKEASLQKSQRLPTSSSVFISPSTVVHATALPIFTKKNLPYTNFPNVVAQFRAYVDSDLQTFSGLYRKVENSKGIFAIEVSIGDPLLNPFTLILKDCPTECRQDLLKKLKPLLTDFGFYSNQRDISNSTQRYLSGSAFPDDASYQEVLISLLQSRNIEEYDENTLLDDHLVSESTMTLLSLKLNEMEARARLISQDQDKNRMSTPKKIPCFLVTQDKGELRLQALTATFNERGVLTSFNSDQNDLTNPFIYNTIQLNLEEGVINLKPNQLLTLRNSAAISAQEKIPSALVLARIAPPKGMIDVLEDPEEDVDCGDNFMDDEAGDLDETEERTSQKRERDLTDDEEVERKRIKANLADDPLNEDQIRLDLSVPNFSDPGSISAIIEGNNLPTRRSDFNFDRNEYQPLSEMRTGAIPFASNNEQRAKSRASLPRIVPQPEPSINYFTAENPNEFWSLVNASDELNQIIAKAQKLEAQILALAKNVVLFESTPQMDIEWENFANFNPTLKPYQRKAAAEICGGRKNILALSMGLGKTRVIAETIAQRIGDKQHLVIAPKSVLIQLSKEINDALSESVITAWLLSSESDVREYIENRVLNDIENALYSFDQNPGYLINLIRIFPKLYEYGFSFDHLRPDIKEELYQIVQNIFKDKVESEIYLFVGLDYTALGLAAKLNSNENTHVERVYDEDKIRNLRGLGLNPNYTSIYDSKKNPSTPVIITTLKKVEEIKQSNNLEFSTIVLDEAQAVHKHSTKSHKAMKELVQTKGNSADALTLLVTGTPYENSIDELVALFEIANRADGNKKPNLIALNQLLTKCAGKLTDGKSTQDIDDKFSALDELLLNALRQYYFFAAYSTERLINLGYSDPIVQESWQGRIPTKEIRPLVCTFTPEEKAELAQIISASKKAFDLMTSTSNCIMRSNFFQRELLGSEPFRLAIEEKKKIIIVMGRHGLSNSLEADIRSQYGDTVSVYPYHGKMKVEDRNNTITAFKNDSGKASVLLLMEKVGGVGLNLPEADVMFKISTLWNPGTAKQIEHRIVRVNNVGQKIIYEPKMDNDFVFEHSEAVRAKKETMDTFLFGTDQSPQAIMKAWVAMLRAQAYHAYLIQTKEPNAAKERTALVETYLTYFEQKVTEDHLKNLLRME